jgi:RimJ/RimL family protein N-acetyltransferase
MNIRLLLEADAPAYQALRLSSLLDTPEAFGSSHEEEAGRSLADVARRIAPGPGRGVFGAFDGEALVGLVGLEREQLLKKRHKAVIWGMVVAPSARGHGLARALVLAALDLARATPGVAKVTLNVDAANVAAIALYESLGFVVFGREQDAMRIGGDVRNDLQMALALGG